VQADAWIIRKAHRVLQTGRVTAMSAFDPKQTLRACVYFCLPTHGSATIATASKIGSATAASTLCSWR
jgi:hypothetical protein